MILYDTCTYIYFSNFDFSGKCSAMNSALARKMASSESRESFIQNIGARRIALRAVRVSVQ